MRRAIQVSLLVLAFSVLNIGLSATGFAQDAAGQDNVIKRDVDLVSLYFTVRDNKKQLASQLDQGEFRVLEDGKEQPIKFFAHHSDVVLNVGVLLDTGTSMAWILNEEATATSMFMKHVVRPTDLGFILSYHARVDTERSHPSGGVDLGLSLRTQNHFLNALLVDMKAVGASDLLHVRVVDPYRAEFVSQENDVFLATLWAVRAQSFVVRHESDFNP